MPDEPGGAHPAIQIAPGAAIAPDGLACPACGVAVASTHPYAWCSACGARFPEALKARLSNSYTRPISPSFVSLREDTGPDVDAVHAALVELMKPPPLNRTALLVTASVVLFAAAEAASGASLVGLALLLGVLFVHEAGHYVAMRAFGYQNVRMFFIPFFGAAVSSPSTGIAAWKQGVVLLAGPVPGIVAGVLLFVVGAVTGARRWHEVAMMALLLNGFNLLPLGPLDGGQLFRLTVFGRWRRSELAFVALTGLILAGLMIWSQAWILALFALIIAGSVRHRSRLLRTAARLRAEHPAMPRDLGALSDDQQRVLYAYGVDAVPVGVDKTATAVAGTMRSLLEALSPPPSVLASAALLAAWAGAVVLAFVAAVVTMLPWQPADWAVRACPNMLVTARFPAEPYAVTETVDGHRADICTAGAAGVGFVSVVRIDTGTTLDQAGRVAAWPLLASPAVVERMIDGRYVADVPLDAEQMLIRFVFDGPIAYRMLVPNSDEAVARLFLESVRLPDRP